MSKILQSSKELIKRNKDYIPLPPKKPNASKRDQDKLVLKIMKQSKNKEVLSIGESTNKEVLLELDSDRLKKPSIGEGKFICYCSSHEVMTQKDYNIKREKISSFLIKQKKTNLMFSLDETRTMNKASNSRSSKSILYQKEYNIIIPGKEQRKCNSVKKIAQLAEYDSNQNQYFNDDNNTAESCNQSQNSNRIRVKKAEDIKKAKQLTSMEYASNPIVLDSNNKKQSTVYTDSAELEIPSYPESNYPTSLRYVNSSTTYNNQGDNQCYIDYIKITKQQGGKIDFNKITDYSPYKQNNLLKKIILIQTQWRKHYYKLNTIGKIILLQSYWRRYWLRLSVYNYITTYYRLRTFISHINKVKFTLKMIFKKEFLIILRNHCSSKALGNNTPVSKKLINNQLKGNNSKSSKSKARKMSTQDKSNTSNKIYNTTSNSIVSKKESNQFNKKKIIFSPNVSEPIKSFSLFSNLDELKINYTNFEIKANTNSLLDDITKNKVRSYVIDNNRCELLIENSMSIKAFYYEEMYNKLLKEIDELNNKYNKNNSNSQLMLEDKGINCSLKQSSTIIDMDNKIGLTFDRIQKNLIISISNNSHMLLPKLNQTKSGINKYILEHINDIELKSLEHLSKIKLIESFDISIFANKKIKQFNNDNLLITYCNGNHNNALGRVSINKKKREFVSDLFSIELIESIDLSSIGANSFDIFNKNNRMNQISQSCQFSLINLNNYPISTLYKSQRFSINFKNQYTKEELTNSLLSSIYQKQISTITQSQIQQLEFTHNLNKSLRYTPHTLYLNNCLTSFSIIHRDKRLESQLIISSNINIQMLSSISKNCRLDNTNQPSIPILQKNLILSFTILTKSNNDNISHTSLSSLSLNQKLFTTLSEHKEKSLSFVSCCPRRIIHKERTNQKRANTSNSQLEEDDLLNSSCTIKSERVSLYNSFRTMPAFANQINRNTKSINADSIFSSSCRQGVAYRITKSKLISHLNKGKNKRKLIKAFLKWNKKALIMKEEYKESIVFENDHRNILCSKNPIANAIIYMKRGISCIKINTIVFELVLKNRFNNWKRRLLSSKVSSNCSFKEKKLSYCLLKISIKKEKSPDNTTINRKYIHKWYNATINPSLSQRQSNTNIVHNHIQPHHHTKNNINKKSTFEEETMHHYSFNSYFTEEFAPKNENKSIIDLNISRISNDTNSNNHNINDISENEIIISMKNHLRLKKVTKKNGNQINNSRKSDNIAKQKKMKIIKRYINNNNTVNSTVSNTNSEPIQDSRGKFKNAIKSIITKTQLKLSYLSLKKYFFIWKNSNIVIQPNRNIKTSSQLKRIKDQIKAKKQLINTIVTLSRVFKFWKKRAQ